MTASVRVVNTLYLFSDLLLILSLGIVVYFTVVPLVLFLKTTFQIVLSVKFTFAAFLTEHLKTALCAETRAWCVAFGRNCNVRYRTEMEEIFTFIEEITKRLSRPIKDLDDIRHAMAALKEIRDREIMIDMSIGPIEVRSLSVPTVQASRITALHARNVYRRHIVFVYSGCVLVLFLQESYAMLNRYELLVAKEESERVDTLRYSWQKLQSLAVSTLMTIC